MALRVEEAQRDMDAFELYDDMREEDMMECIGLMHHPKDAVNISFQNSIKCYSLRDNDGLYCSLDRKSTRLNSSHSQQSRMPSSA